MTLNDHITKRVESGQMCIPNTVCITKCFVLVASGLKSKSCCSHQRFPISAHFGFRSGSVPFQLHPGYITVAFQLHSSSFLTTFQFHSGSGPISFPLRFCWELSKGKWLFFSGSAMRHPAVRALHKGLQFQPWACNKLIVLCYVWDQCVHAHQSDFHSC